mmetsp:Transcript_15348/g.31619  ORF Transcript_15348/g.31619 Transcript_15348/m.31619 type:complete len:209 (-) Transcript_15348:271-897(-)|eukprot:CAMPEP_0196753660 /NCGR_PEP_ID=MMETSP1091-20130531/91576_1 /TAXON_ID=302021 /ORGANISM="Rhodomonas sp., Strain CCMP768" /LENGTH=208 /DNA_ID=CAMNT_0042101807 /DNA_START=47 /DNA_END=673 /DNA_ORIENTATION=-
MDRLTMWIYSHSTLVLLHFRFLGGVGSKIQSLEPDRLLPWLVQAGGVEEVEVDDCSGEKEPDGEKHWVACRKEQHADKGDSEEEHGGEDACAQPAQSDEHAVCAGGDEDGAEEEHEQARRNIPSDDGDDVAEGVEHTEDAHKEEDAARHAEIRPLAAHPLLCFFKFLQRITLFKQTLFRKLVSEILIAYDQHAGHFTVEKKNGSNQNK